jgi:hypothetical protein
MPVNIGESHQSAARIVGRRQTRAGKKPLTFHAKSSCGTWDKPTQVRHKVEAAIAWLAKKDELCHEALDAPS